MQGVMGSIPGWGTKIPHATQHGQNNNNNNSSSNNNNKEKKTDLILAGWRGGQTVCDECHWEYRSQTRLAKRWLQNKVKARVDLPNAQKVRSLKSISYH